MTAQEMIYTNSGVGADLRARRSEPAARGTVPGTESLPESQPPHFRPPLPNTSSQGNIFLKPSGVDEPADLKESIKPSGPVIPSKRERDVASELSSLEGKKRKKKKIKAE